MKKNRIFVLLSIVCVGFFVAALARPLDAAAADRPKSVSLASAGEGTSQFAVHAGMTTLITKYMGIRAVPEASSVGGKTLYLLHNGEVEIGCSTDHAAYDAAHGSGQFEKSGKLNFRLMSAGAGFHLGLSTLRDSGIRSVRDLKGKRVQATHPGNITFTKAMDLFLEAEGMTRADINELKFYGSRDIAPALKEGRSAASVTGLSLSAVPGWLQNLNLEVPVVVFAPPREKIAAVLPNYPYFREGVVSADIYGNIVDGKDLPTIGAGMSLYCRTDLPDDFVYEIMEAVFGHKDELKAFHKSAGQWTDDLVGKPVAPFHPGAVRYYKEQGLWSTDLEKDQKRLLAEMG
jgi:TRAP transporter TAXI family solute receptor